MKTKHPIPETDWVWQGHAGHFCASDSCKFRLATRVGDYLISTVGDYYPPSSKSRECIGSGIDAYFETFVFKAGKTLECGCADIEDGIEVEGVRYGSAGKAQRGHLTMCRKYAGLE